MLTMALKKKYMQVHENYHMCPVRGKVVDPEAHDAEYVRTKRKSHIFVHSGCVKNRGKV